MLKLIALILLSTTLLSGCSTKFKPATEHNAGAEFRKNVATRIPFAADIKLTGKDGNTGNYQFLSANDEGLFLLKERINTGSTILYGDSVTIPYESVLKIDYRAPTGAPDKAGDKAAAGIGRAIYTLVLIPVAILCLPLGCSVL